VLQFQIYAEHAFDSTRSLSQVPKIHSYGGNNTSIKGQKCVEHLSDAFGTQCSNHMRIRSERSDPPIVSGLKPGWWESRNELSGEPGAVQREATPRQSCLARRRNTMARERKLQPKRIRAFLTTAILLGLCAVSVGQATVWSTVGLAVGGTSRT